MPTTTRTTTEQPAAGRWITRWDPEDPVFWQATGRRIAAVNLRWSIAAEFLGFSIWQLMAIVAIYLPAAGFEYSTAQLFWLISLPSLVGATLRFPYTFMAARFGGRNWTAVSALLLLIPAAGFSVALAHPGTDFWVMLLLAGCAGLGGGNFASSAANIAHFYPAASKGWALGVNAAGGNLGSAVAQLLVPVAIALAGAGTLRLEVAGLVWIPLILLAAAGAWRSMHNLSQARNDVRGTLRCLREKHLWIIASLYLGTFGSFIGFSAVFPKLIADSFPGMATLPLGPAAISLAFLGPLVGSLTRPLGGSLADRFGGARITLASFGCMALLVLGLILALQTAGFWMFLLLFLGLFACSGIGNGSTYRMIPAVFAAQGRPRRTAAAAVGLVSALGAYGGFAIPQALGASMVATGSYAPALAGFVAAYLLLMLVAWACYVRPASDFAAQGV